MDSEAKTDLPIKLLPGKVMNGRVLDSDGRPVAGATIYTQSWANLIGLAWHSKTDAEGRFRWDSAPESAVMISANKMGYAIDQHLATAGEAEQTWKLLRSISVHGKVTDAETAAKVPRFEVEVSEDGPKPVVVNGAVFPGIPNKTHLWGQYQFQVQDPREAYHLVFTAQGYAPLSTLRLDPEQPDVLCDVKLVKLAPGEGGGPTRIVLGLDGKPLKGADVLLATARDWATLTNGQAHPPEGYMGWSGVGYVNTGDDGTFTFSPIQSNFHLAIVHDLGFARTDAASLTKEPRIPIRPWGRIEGEVAPGPGRAIDVGVHASSNGKEALSPINASYQNIKIDKNGRFVIERMTPGIFRIQLNRETTKRSEPVGAPVQVEIESGKTAHVSIGGS